MRELTPDICVIGGGSGGLTVAAAAAAFGVDVVLIEKGKMGGDCLNYGCVPSKALIASASHAHAIASAPAFGVDAGKAKVDFEAVHRHVHAVIGQIAPNDSEERFRAMGVNVVRARARFVDDRTVEADDLRIRARRFVIATGSRPMVPPIPGLAETPHLTNETLFDRTRRPEHLIVIGGGPIGLEMAQAHRRLGSEVTVVEGLRLLSKEDPEAAAIVADRLRAEGIALVEGAKVTGVEKAEGGVRVTYEKDGESVSVAGSDILVATGRAANVGDLGLDKAGIRHDRTGVKVGANLRSSNRRVYAIGDAVSGGLQFTHVAGYQAGLVVQQILFRLPARENRHIIPRVTFTKPELAHVGMSEEEARKARGGVGVLRWPYAENDRAQAERETQGEIKLVIDRRARILGATIVGAGAGEMINFWALAISRKLSLSDVRGFVPAYPTMNEIGKRAAISYYSPMMRKPAVRRLIAFLRRFG